MNKIICTLIGICMGLVATAQDKTTGGSLYEHRNVLKLNINSLFLGNFMVQDEFTLSHHTSIALAVSYLPERGLPSAAVKDDADLKSLSFSGQSYTPEFRYYFSENSPKGFYMATYYRYAKYTTNTFEFKYDRDDGTQDIVNMSGSMTGSTFGLMLGSQWILGNHISLDWWIIGAGVGSITFDGLGIGTFTPGQQQDIRDQVETTDVPVGTLTSDIDANSVSIKYKTGVGMRGFGLCLGYIF